MPKITTTRTRIADQGKPRIITLGDGFGLEVARNPRRLKSQISLFVTSNIYSLQLLLNQSTASARDIVSSIFFFRKRTAEQNDFYFSWAMVEFIFIKLNDNSSRVSVGGLIQSITMRAFVHFKSRPSFGNKVVTLPQVVTSFCAIKARDVASQTT